MKKLISVLSCLCILLSNSYYSYAVESTQFEEENYSYEYYNKDTGEYFIWEGTNPNSRSNVVGTFRFKIQRFLRPDKNFFFKTDKVKVVMNEAYFANYEGVKKSYCNKHRFNISVQRYGVTNNYAYFTAPIISTTSKKLGGGFLLSPTPYRIEITNESELPSYVFLCGSGNISNY